MKWCLSVYGIYWTFVKRGPFVQTIFPSSPSLVIQTLAFSSPNLLSRNAVCVDLSLALVDRGLVLRRTGYLLLQLLFGC